jgi:hypothetical protein
MRANISVGEEVSVISWSANIDITLCFSYVEIVKVDLQTGTHQLLLLARCPYTDHDTLFHHPILSGALAAVGTSITGRDDTHLILDWKAQSSFLFVGPSVCACAQISQTPWLIYIKEGISSLALVPGHLILKPFVRHPAEGVQRVQELHVISHDALTPHFRHTNIGVDGSEAFSPVSPDDLTKLLTWSGDAWITNMSVHASPLRADEYRVWLYGINYSDTEPVAATWCSRLCIASGQWRLGPHRPFAYRQMHPTFTYAGHLLTWSNGKQHIRSITASSERGELNTEGVALTMNLTSYSGALSYFSSDTTIVIKHYK